MKKKYTELEYPRYEILLEDDVKSGIRFLSIVGEPAIEMMGMAFSKSQVPISFEFKETKEKQCIIGPAMIPNKDILRKDENGDKYYVTFSPETIQKMVNKFNQEGTNKKINVDHSNRIVDAFIVESWIVEDAYHDKSKLYGFSVPVGTWMVCIKINDEKFWKNEVKGLGKFGFSIEGMMSQRPMDKFSVEYDSIEDVIDTLTDEEIIEMFNDVAQEADADFVVKFLSQRGHSNKECKFSDDELDLPDTERVYTYRVKAGMGESIQENTRDFCKHMIMIDRYWSESDVNELSDRLGYSFWDYFGSYNCRHELVTTFVSGNKNKPTDKEISTGVGMQQDDGLAFGKVFEARRQCFGCPPAGTGKNADGSDDRRCRKGKPVEKGGGIGEINKVGRYDPKFEPKRLEDADSMISDKREGVKIYGTKEAIDGVLEKYGNDAAKSKYTKSQDKIGRNYSGTSEGIVGKEVYYKDELKKSDLPGKLGDGIYYYKKNVPYVSVNGAMKEVDSRDIDGPKKKASGYRGGGIGLDHVHTINTKENYIYKPEKDDE